MTVVAIASTAIRRGFGQGRTGYCKVDTAGRVWAHGVALNLVTGANDFSITSPEQYDPATGLWTTLAAAPERGYYAYSYDAAGVVYAAIASRFGTTSDDCDKYDPATDTWTAITTIPNSLNGRVAPAYWTTPDDLLWVCGGLDNSSNTLTETMYYNKVLDTWTTQASTAPELFSLQSMFGNDESRTGGCLLNAAGTVVYTVGFNSGHFFSYTIATDTWLQLTDSPYSSGSAFACIGADDRTYLSAGWDLYVYDPLTNVWSTRSTPVGATPFHGTVGMILSLNGSIYGIGSSGTRVIQQYDIATDTWSDTWSDTLDAFSGTGELVWDGTGYYNIDEASPAVPAGRTCEYWTVAAVRRSRSAARWVG